MAQLEEHMPESTALGANYYRSLNQLIQAKRSDLADFVDEQVLAGRLGYAEWQDVELDEEAVRFMNASNKELLLEATARAIARMSADA